MSGNANLQAASRSDALALAAQLGDLLDQENEREAASAEDHFPAPRGLRSTAETAPSVKVTTEGQKTVVAVHGGPAKAFGSENPVFVEGLVNSIVQATKKAGRADEAAISFAVAIVSGIGARDEVEAMLASQMASVHLAVATAANRLAHAENPQQFDAHQNAFNKLARTFAAQVDALKRYRNTGEQKMTVQHVTVADGGQAIVGTVHHGGGAAKKKGGASS